MRRLFHARGILVPLPTPEYRPAGPEQTETAPYFQMKTLGIAGYSGSGKTTLMTRLIPDLLRRGLTVSTIKHTHHSVALDKKHTLSRALQDAGAIEVVYDSGQSWTLLHELRGAPEATIEELMDRMEPVDLLLVEGFKTHRHDKIEIHRPATGKPLLCPDDPHIVAVASDASLPDVTLPKLDLNDVSAIGDFIVTHLKLDRKP